MSAKHTPFPYPSERCPQGIPPSYLADFPYEVAVAAKVLSDAIFDATGDQDAETLAAAFLLAVMPNWQPIETAPRDEEFLAYDSRTKKQSVANLHVTRMKGGEWIRVYPTQSDGEMGPSEDEFGYNNEDVTHWMPLPPAPESQP